MKNKTTSKHHLNSIAKYLSNLLFASTEKEINKQSKTKDRLKNLSINLKILKKTIQFFNCIVF